MLELALFFFFTGVLHFSTTLSISLHEGVNSILEQHFYWRQ